MNRRARLLLRTLAAAAMVVAAVPADAAKKKGAAPREPAAAQVDSSQKAFDELNTKCSDTADDKLDAALAACTTWLEVFHPNARDVKKDPAYLSSTGIAIAYENIAYAKWKKKDFAAASAAADQAIAADKARYYGYYVKSLMQAEQQNFAEAVKNLTIVIRIKDHSGYRLERAKAFIKLDNKEEALADLNVAADKTSASTDIPFRIEILSARAELQKDMKKYKGAYDDYTELNKIDPTSTKWDMGLAWVFYLADQDEDALNAVNRVIALEPGNADAYQFRAQLYQDDADDDVEKAKKAIADYEKVKELNKGNAVALAFGSLDDDDLAKLYAKVGDTDKALKMMDELIAKSPDSWLGYDNRSDLHLENKNYAAALADAQKAAELAEKEDPNDRWNHQRHEGVMRVYVAMGKLQEGLNYLVSTWKTDKDAKASWIYFGSVFKDTYPTREEALKIADALRDAQASIKGDLPAAKAVLACREGTIRARYEPDKAMELLKASEKDDAFCSVKGRTLVHRLKGEDDAELAAYDAFLKAEPGSSRIIELRGDWHLRHGNLDKAMADAEAVIKADKLWSAGYALQADVNAVKGDLTIANIQADAFLKSFPKLSTAHAVKSRVQLRLKNFDAALASALTAVEKSEGKYAQALNTLALAQEAKGQVNEALASHRSALALPNAQEYVIDYQKALAEAGLYSGAVDGARSPVLEKAMEDCLKKPDCEMPVIR